MRILFTLVIICWSSLAFTQWKLPVNLIVGKEKIELKKSYLIENSSVALSKVKFYLMDFRVYSNGNSIAMISQAVLIDAENENFILMNEKEPTSIDSITFLLGTNNEVNEQLVLDGDLNPINGMYWAWNSGYINLKIEGTILTGNSMKKVEYHLGGFQKEFPTAQKLTIISQNNTIALNFNLEKIIQVLIAEEDTEIMIPGKKAADLMMNIAKNLEE